MTINKNIQSIYLKETSIVDILLMILLQNNECTNHLQNILEEISIREEDF